MVNGFKHYWVEQLHILFADHETAARQIGHMRVIVDTQTTRQFLDVLLDGRAWCSPSPDVGTASCTLGKVHDAEFLNEVLVLHLLPELFCQSLLVDVEEEES